GTAKIDHRQSIEGEKGKKKRRRRKKTSFPRAVLARAPSLPAGRPRAVLACGGFFSCEPAGDSSPARLRAIVLPCEETERLPARGERSRRRR
ncbi:hypothetical protein BHM03_00046262, partial [Ensete ventricosum]